jgi:hypothetical protein
MIMRIAVAAMGLILLAGEAFSQQTPTADPAKDSQHSSGRTVIPKKQGPAQPQGNTGPLETKSGGAPAESPQGQTPPGMQAAPEGSSKTIVDTPAKK